MFHIRTRLRVLGKTQVWLIFELRKRGLTVQPSELSTMIRGVCTYPKAKRVLEMSDKILAEVETRGK